MLIVQAKGQTCNQFWIYTNFIADCIERNEKLVIWIPDITIRDFTNLRKSEYLQFIFYHERLIQLVGYKRYFKYINLLFKNEFFLKTAQLASNLIPGIRFINADVSLVKSQNRIKHLSKLKTIFKPNEDILNQAEDLFNQYRHHNTLIVGIHIRRGDYKSFHNGAYYYSLEQYNLFLKKLTNLFNKQHLAFFLASNEDIDISKFSEYNCFKFNTGSSTLDMVGLSICDYICGPPSTFSTWASFYHDRPLYYIENINAPITTADFFHIKDRLSSSS